MIKTKYCHCEAAEGQRSNLRISEKFGVQEPFDHSQDKLAPAYASASRFTPYENKGKTMENQISETSQKNQLVTFLLGEEVYGIDIFMIQEVLHYQEVTSVPHAPDFVKGIIRVRDQVIPVVDLRERLGIEADGKTKKRIVILDLDRPLGVIVDDISRVLLMHESNFEPLPDAVVSDRDQACISRIAKAADELVIVISPERILSRTEKEKLQSFEENQEQKLLPAEADALSSP